MKVKALKSFAGKVTMAPGEVRDIKDKAVVQDLLQAGYVEEVKSGKKKTKADEKVKTDEN